MKRSLNAIILMLSALVIFLASSFAWTDPQVYLLLEEINGLKANDEVFFKDIPVGFVEDINLFEETLDEHTYFVVTLVIQKDKFKHLYREMNFNVKSIYPLAAQKKLVIDEKSVMKLNKLQRNEFIVGSSSNQDFVDRAVKILGRIGQETQPMRQQISNQVRTRIRTLVGQLNLNSADSTTG